jgi:hypothetical protein
MNLFFQRYFMYKFFNCLNLIFQSLFFLLNVFLYNFNKLFVLFAQNLIFVGNFDYHNDFGWDIVLNGVELMQFECVTAVFLSNRLLEVQELMIDRFICSKGSFFN